jgi:hypothetical protein
MMELSVRPLGWIIVLVLTSGCTGSSVEVRH